MRTTVAIIGGGLSGLYAASLLHRQGVECLLFEARARLGGRILSVDGSAPGMRHDLGPAWFWPDMQPQLRQLTHDLGLQAYEQHTVGAILVERFQLEAPQRYERGLNSEPRSMRLAGGMQALVDGLAATLPQHIIQCDAPVTAIREGKDGLFQVDAGAEGALRIAAEQVILALPPRLLVRIVFDPGLPESVVQWCRATPTWMAGQAKCLAVYDKPFWKSRGFSGTASSFLGPMMEIHDASTPEGSHALFGFMGLSARARQALGQEALKQAALAQWARLFGAEALHPVAVHVADWALEAQTATVADWEPPSVHPAFGLPPDLALHRDGRLLLAGTEAAQNQGGYLEGAIEAAQAAVDQVLRRVRPTVS